MRNRVRCETEEKMPKFETWSFENLVKFAHEANEKLQEQNDRIQQLQCDLKDAIAAYRELMLLNQDR
jgi:hypothetical protein